MTLQKQKVIFIDRDGVLNWDPIGDYIKRWEDFRFFPGVLDSLRSLTQAGYTIIILSNQAGVGEGVYPQSELDRITENMLREIERHGGKISRVLYCTHPKNGNCSCRKPKVGLFEQASKGLFYNKSETFYVGDKLTDVQAGRIFGLKTIMVQTGHGESDQKKIDEGSKPDYLVKDFVEAVQLVLEKQSSPPRLSLRGGRKADEAI